VWRASSSTGLLALAVAAVTGCKSSPTPAAPEPEPSPAATDSGTIEAAPPDAAWMTRVAAGEVPLGSLIDERRGLAYAAYYTDASDEDPAADAEGLVKVAERACGERLAALTAELTADLRRRLEIEDPAPFRCQGWTCLHEAAGEYDLDGRYSFAASPDGTRLVAVARIEGGPVTEEFVAEGEQWVAEALAALEPPECAAP
jgi:hypothetical protein